METLVYLERLAAVRNHHTAPRQLHLLGLLGLLERHDAEELHRFFRVELVLLGQLVDDLLQNALHRSLHTDPHTVLGTALDGIGHVELNRRHDVVDCFAFACLLFDYVMV